VSGQPAGPGVPESPPVIQAPPLPKTSRRDATLNHQRVLDAAREVFGESGADASIEEIAARAGVGVGTVYRRFTSKDGLIDELLRLVLEDMMASAEQALARADGHGLDDFLRAIGQSFADHARYADLLLGRPADPDASRRIRATLGELTARAVAAGTINPDITIGDVMALVWAIRGIVQAAGEVAPRVWRRHLDIHLAGMGTPGPLSDTAAMTTGELAEVAPQSTATDTA
jgi:AcrR family transcriptional regulator